ncbi:MAG TPA: gliding motility-associated C-terminal domain-containing protein, partial [Bacteroidia bacterium]
TAPAQSTQTATGLSAGNYSVTVSDANGCTATTSVSVSNINGTASISSSTNVLCHGGANGSAVAVSSGSAPFTYSWSNGNNTQSVTGLAAGTYSVAITDVNGCVGTASVLITQPAALSFTISSTANTKCNFPNGTVTMNIAGGSNPFTYRWSTIPVQTTATAAALTAGTYSVVVTDKNGCTVTSSVTVAAPSLPVINIMGNTTICQGSSTMLIASGGAIYWNPGHQDADTIVSPSVTTNYSVVAVGANGCTNTSSVTVTVIPRPVAGINGNTNICIGETATLTAFGGGSYLWSPGGQTSSAISTSTGGMYSVIVTAGSCSATATHPVIVHPPPTANAGANATVNYGSSTQLSASGGSSYNWEPSAGLSCTNCANPICAPAAATTYTVIATDANGCTASAMVTVYVNEECGELYLPNAFSPNGDGENDYLHIDIMNPVCISEFKISIWDRWGNKVFESTDKNFKWNGDDAYGLFPGSERTAVFVYRMTAVLMERKVIERKGNISLIR